MGYQERDYEVVDYELFSLPGAGLLRGPKPETIDPDRYFTCLGAAQTFGCFCEKPFPSLLSERLGLPVLNLGYAGAGPRLFLANEARLHYVNESRFAVIQIMSGRSEDNSAFRTGGLATIAKQPGGAQAQDGRQPLRAEEAWGELLAAGELEAVRVLVDETRANWVESFAQLLDAIEVPRILFWFSNRPPDYEESYTDLHALFGEFPQLVTRAMVEQIRSRSDDYVECVSTRGVPQLLVSRFTGEPVTVTDQVWFPDQAALRTVEQPVNSYYPSPEMHADAADALMAACSKYAVL
jgi:hypothetical protein